MKKTLMLIGLSIVCLIPIVPAIIVLVHGREIGFTKPYALFALVPYVNLVFGLVVAWRLTQNAFGKEYEAPAPQSADRPLTDDELREIHPKRVV